MHADTTRRIARHVVGLHQCRSRRWRGARRGRVASDGSGDRPTPGSADRHVARHGIACPRHRLSRRHRLRHRSCRSTVVGAEFAELDRFLRRRRHRSVPHRRAGPVIHEWYRTDSCVRPRHRVGAEERAVAARRTGDRRRPVRARHRDRRRPRHRLDTAWPVHGDHRAPAAEHDERARRPVRRDRCARCRAGATAERSPCCSTC